MKAGRSLSELAAELERQQQSKKDYVAATRRMSMRALTVGKDTPHAKVILEGVNGGMPLRPIAHQQLAGSLGIPKVYYDRMLAEAPELLCKTVPVL